MELDLFIFFCSVIMIFIVIKTIKDKTITKLSKRYFLFCLSAAIVMLVSDGLSIMINAEHIKSNITMNYIVQIVYFISASITSFFCFLVVDSMGDSPLIKNRRNSYLLASPILIYIILLFISLGTGWIFSIDSSNKYVRGPINFFQFIFCHSYLIAAFVVSIYKYLKYVQDPNRDVYFANIMFCLMPMLGAALQYALSIVFKVDIPLLSAGIAFSSVILFIEMVQNQASIDSLTGLSTRKAFYKYLNNLNQTSLDCFYIFMIDINKFKDINDQYGHLEGDNALILFAKALKIQTRKKGGYVARLGGDEFVIAVELINDEAKIYLDELLEEISNVNKYNNINYILEASIGYSKVENDGIQGAIKRADEQMYRQKHKI